MKKEIRDLIEISHFYGKNKDYIIAAGGNTSYKEDRYIYVKTSGINLATITQNGFIKLEREKIHRILSKRYSDNSIKQESQIKNDLFKCRVEEKGTLRPSVETLLHNLMEYKYVVHTHPYIINALICSRKGEEITTKLFGNRVLFSRYTKPGYILAKKTNRDISLYRKKYKQEPHVIFMQNHGVFIGADSTEHIKKITYSIVKKIQDRFKKILRFRVLTRNTKSDIFLSALHLFYPENKVVKLLHNNFIKYYYNNRYMFNKIAGAFIPDNIVYCRAGPVYIEKTDDIIKMGDQLGTEIKKFKMKYNYLPKVIVAKNIGFISIGDTKESAEVTADTFNDIMKVSYYSENFGGPKFLSKSQVIFIDQWEIENYRRKLAKFL